VAKRYRIVGTILKGLNKCVFFAHSTPLELLLALLSPPQMEIWGYSISIPSGFNE